MRTMLLNIGGALIAALCILVPMKLFAEQVSHHSLTVEADGPARGCIACHDGSLAHTVSYCTVQCGFKTPHSILKDYPPRGKEALYAPVAAISAAGIKFENGKVTCISCHNLRDPKKHHLVMENSHSRLCLTCHIRM